MVRIIDELDLSNLTRFSLGTLTPEEKQEVRVAVTTHSGHLFQFMPYGAPELKEAARKYMVRATMVGCALWIVVFTALARHQRAACG